MLRVTWPRWLIRLSSPEIFYHTASRWQPWLLVLGWLLLLTGLVAGLWFAPSDYQQGDGFRIIYWHVPAAWMSLFVYLFMTACAAVYLIWRLYLAWIALVASAMIGALFTLIALTSGAIWGKPMWGTWWVWDARLTAELILLFIYLGVVALDQALEQDSKAVVVSLFTLVGSVNIPIVYFSVQWWSTLHQGATFTLTQAPSMDSRMLWPLLITAMASKVLYVSWLLRRMQTRLIADSYHQRWVQRLYSVKRG